MVMAFLMGAATTGILAALGGYLLGSRVPDFQEQAVKWQYEHRHENCVYDKDKNKE
jgi:hypothetical protein